MSTFLLLAALIWNDSSLLRIQYDIEIFQNNRKVLARMVLNKYRDNHFSIHCYKSPGGTLFTFWATPQENVFYVPRAKLAFSGPENEAFQLIPGGPSLTRNLWLEMLQNQPADKLGDYVFVDLGDWKMLRDSATVDHIRWVERKRSQRTSFKARVLEPRLRQKTLVRSLQDIPDYWNEKDIE